MMTTTLTPCSLLGRVRTERTCASAPSVASKHGITHARVVLSTVVPMPTTFTANPWRDGDVQGSGSKYGNTQVIPGRLEGVT